MENITKAQKSAIRAWVKEQRNSWYVWINKDGAVNYSDDSGSFFAGWDTELLKEMENSKTMQKDY